MYLQIKGQLLSLTSPLIMGVINYTDDSFYQGSRFPERHQVLHRIEELLSEGADIIDIGTVSTRPGAATMDESLEIKLVEEIVSLIIKSFPHILLSVDTWRASVARVAVSEGASMINDISGGTFDDNMAETIAQLNVPYCLMHTSDFPQFMQEKTTYEHILSDIFYFFGKQIEKFNNAGVKDIIIDPGFGFGKTIEDNYFLLKNLLFFKELKCPILVGLSRKSMIYKLLETTPDKALNGTSALNMIALQNGANILRVHDVAAAKEVLKLYQQIETL